MGRRKKRDIFKTAYANHRLTYKVACSEEELRANPRVKNAPHTEDGIRFVSRPAKDLFPEDMPRERGMKGSFFCSEHMPECANMSPTEKDAVDEWFREYAKRCSGYPLKLHDVGMEEQLITYDQIDSIVKEELGARSDKLVKAEVEKRVGTELDARVEAEVQKRLDALKEAGGE